MSVISKKNALELQRIVKDATGRDITIGDAYGLWSYVLKLLALAWKIEDRGKPVPSALQTSLFDARTEK